MSIVNHSYTNLIRRSLINKRLSRDFPLLAALHRLTDGALLGFVVTVVAMSVISLHAQHLWTLSFTRLEASRNLIHKLKESISILESHFLDSKSLPSLMVETKTSNLIYLDKPNKNSRLKKYDSTFDDFINKVFYSPANHGY